LSSQSPINEMPSSHEITELLQAWSRGDSKALENLMRLVDSELKKIAHAYMKQERAGHILQTTALVHEALMRLLGPERITWHDRRQFYAIVARRMRQVLIDEAREQTAGKRGNRAEHVDLADAAWLSAEQSQELILLNEALIKLAKIDPRKEEIAEYRYFGGFTLPEVAELLDVAPRTVEREWKLARAWLKREIDSSE
jgi:RNA polymerase sigma-70 factor, ECF subfamily